MRTVRVLFPEGVRDIQATYEQQPDVVVPFGNSRRNFGDVLIRMVPVPSDRWEYHEIIGTGDYSFVAYEKLHDRSRMEHPFDNY